MSYFVKNKLLFSIVLGLFFLLNTNFTNIYANKPTHGWGTQLEIASVLSKQLKQQGYPGNAVGEYIRKTIIESQIPWDKNFIKTPGWEPNKTWLDLNDTERARRINIINEHINDFIKDNIEGHEQEIREKYGIPTFEKASLASETSTTTIETPIPEKLLHAVKVVNTQRLAPEEIQKIQNLPLFKGFNSFGSMQEIIKQIKENGPISKLDTCGGLCKLGIATLEGRAKRQFLLDTIARDFNDEKIDQLVKISSDAITVTLNYVSFGSGELLQDFIILNMLIEKINTRINEVKKKTNLPTTSKIVLKIILIDQIYTHIPPTKTYVPVGDIYSCLQISKKADEGSMGQFTTWFNSLENVQADIFMYRNSLLYIDDCEKMPELKGNILVCVDAAIDNSKLIFEALKDNALFYELSWYKYNRMYKHLYNQSLFNIESMKTNDPESGVFLLSGKFITKKYFDQLFGEIQAKMYYFGNKQTYRVTATTDLNFGGGMPIMVADFTQE